MPGPMDNKHGYAKPKNAKKTFGRILKYMGKSKIFLIVVFLSLILSTVCQIGASYWLRPILNGIEESVLAGNFMTQGIKELVKNLVIVGALYCGTALFSYIQSRVMVTIAYKTTNLIRKELFNHMQSLPLRYFDSKTHGEIMSRFTNDVDNVQMMLEQSMVQLVSSAFTFVGIIVMMIFLSPLLFGIALIFLVIMVIAVTKIGKQSRKYFRAQQKELGIMNGNIEESVEGLKVVKVFNHEEKINEEFCACNEKFRKAATNANFFAGIMGPSSTGINNASYATIALAGGLLALTSGIDIGAYFTFLSYSKQFTQPINQIANQMNTIFSALAGAERVFEVMDMEPEVDEGTVTLEEKYENGERKLFWNDGGNLVPVEGNVVFKDVNFSYVPEKPVLKEISLYAKSGQKIAFVGSTGAGKTTITNLINRFYDIQDGKIRYDGININKIKKDDLRRSLGIVLQDTNLFTGTVMENIRYGRLDATDEEVYKAAKIANAYDFITRLPEGFNTMLTGDGSNLSQGQRQLLSIARAAIADAPVMILDEATSSIDTRTEALVQRGTDQLMKGRTVFVIAHRLSTVQNSDAIMVLDHGRIIERGSHESLIEQKGTYYQLYTGAFELE